MWLRAFPYALSLLIPCVAQARGFHFPATDELDKASTLICNAVVESVTDTGKPIVGVLCPEKRMEAKLKVLHVFKGRANAQITIAYRNIDWTHLTIITDGPDEIHLEPGSRYRFFLVPDQVPGVYTDAQYKTQDEALATQPLGVQEHDDSAYVSKAEAEKIAIAYVRIHAPEILTHLPQPDVPWSSVFPHTGIPGAPGTLYMVDFYGNPVTPNESAHVAIWGDRSVDLKETKLTTQ
jgi:hypothetical protein